MSNLRLHPVDVQGELEYEIAEVTDSKIDRRRSCKLLYLVHWLGDENTDEEFSWLPATELEHAKDLISDFHSAYPDKPGPLTNLSSFLSFIFFRLFRLPVPSVPIFFSAHFFLKQSLCPFTKQNILQNILSTPS